MSDKLATPEDKVGQVKGSLSGILAYKKQQFQFTRLHLPKPMEPFSANEVASVLGVPLPATPPEAPLKMAKHAGLLSMEMEHRKTTIWMDQFLGEMVAHK